MTDKDNLFQWRGTRLIEWISPTSTEYNVRAQIADIEGTEENKKFYEASLYCMPDGYQRRHFYDDHTLEQVKHETLIKVIIADLDVEYENQTKAEKRISILEALHESVLTELKK